MHPSIVGRWCPFISAFVYSSPTEKPSQLHQDQSFALLLLLPPSFLFFFLTQDGDGCHSGTRHMCGSGRKPATASVTVLFLKLSKSLMPVVGVTQPGLLDRAYDERELNESIQTSKELETNSSHILTVSSSVKTGHHWMELRTKKCK